MESAAAAPWSESATLADLRGHFDAWELSMFGPFRIRPDDCRPAGCHILLAALHLLPALTLAAPPPSVVWTHQWNGPTNHQDEGRLVACAPAGGVYVAGVTYVPGVGGSEDDWFLQRLGPAGNLLWTRSHGGPFVDTPTDLLVTASGDVNLTGIVWQAGGPLLTTLRYDGAGNVVWQRELPLAQAFFWPGHAPRLASDPDGNLLLCADSHDDYLVLKYAPDGTLLWSRSWDAPAGGVDSAAGLAVGADGSVYVTGLAHHGAPGRLVCATVKFDADGVLQWEQFEPGDFGSFFDFADVAVAPDGDVVVTANPESTCGLFQVRTWKLAAATGNPRWLAVFPPGPCDSVEPVAAAVDVAGNTVVAAYGVIGGVTSHFQTLGYAPDGQLRWHREFDGAGTDEDVAAALALDADGNAYVCGLTNTGAQDRDFATVKYSPAGDEVWAAYWAGPFGTNDGAVDLALDPAGDVFVTGHAYHPAQNENSVTVRYHQPSVTATPLPGGDDGLRLRVVLSPFARDTAFRCSLPAAGPLRLEVFDVRGCRVRLLSDGFAPAGDQVVPWQGDDDLGRPLPAGIYLGRLQTARGVATARAALVR